MTRTHILGFPRIGAARELKFAVEAYWRHDIDATQLLDTGRRLRARHWQWQREAGLDFVCVGDFAWYDHVLNCAALFGAQPARFGYSGPLQLDQYFELARGNATQSALELTKWFDSNYHYLVPEFCADTRFQLAPQWLLPEVDEALALGHAPKPVLLGPLSLLYLGKHRDGRDAALRLLAPLLNSYWALLRQLAARGIAWVQLDEPILALDLPADWLQAYDSAYRELASAGPALMMGTYFGSIAAHLPRLAGLPLAGLHVDAVRAPAQLDTCAAIWPRERVLSIGCVDGRNIWRREPEALLPALRRWRGDYAGELWLAPNCSLLHVPVDLRSETALADPLRARLSFAVQKLDEVVALARRLDAAPTADSSAEHGPLIPENRSGEPAPDVAPAAVPGTRPTIRARVAALSADDARRANPFAVRKPLQLQARPLPLLPTTTIGSFPQTAALREARAQWRRGALGEEPYRERMRAEIRDVIARQERLGLDVFVHGEAERNDMVEYFGEQLAGFALTGEGWVQSYGSRCVKPPIIHADVERLQPMTVDWTRYAQAQTARPVKGMLTGPVTLLQWSFVREDQPRAQTALQLALAVRDEVGDLEAAGIGIIQIDEPAFREGLPLRRCDWPDYLHWAVHAFRVASCGVRDTTQIHTHMCYSEFNDILDSIAALDADVITIETSRSHMELLQGFAAREDCGEIPYPNDIGPGVYDIHAPRVPTIAEMSALIAKALSLFPAERLWINPDCGCKTRAWPETEQALRHMVAAAQAARAPRAETSALAAVG